MDYIRMVRGDISEDEIVAPHVGYVGKAVWKIDYSELSKEQVIELMELVKKNESSKVASAKWFKLGFDNHGNPKLYDIVLQAKADVILVRADFESKEIVKLMVFEDKVIALYYREFISASGSEYGREAWIAEVNF